MRELRKVEEQMKQVKGGVTAAKGFEAASTAAGIKYKDRTDMALYTARFHAWQQEHLQQML